MPSTDEIIDQNGDKVLAPELGQKLIVALRSVTDPSAMMQAISDRGDLAIRRDLMTRIDAMDKATSLWHEDLVRIPTAVTQATTSLRDVLEQSTDAKIARIVGDITREIERGHGELKELGSVSEERFRSIQTQFTLLKQATEQLDLANKTAIAAALQAQKESAGETQKSSQAAIAKSETSTAEAIKALTATFSTDTAGIKQQITDLKSRMDRGEGQSGITDPATARALTDMAVAVSALRVTTDRSGGRDQASSDIGARMLAIMAIAISAIGVMAAIFTAVEYVHH